DGSRRAAGRPRDVFDADSEPDVAPRNAAGSSAHSIGDDDDDGEFFPEPPPSSSSSPSPARGSPSYRHRRQSPRAGPHASAPPSPPPPANRGRKTNRTTTAKDVWTFFDKQPDARHCLFCKSTAAANPNTDVPEPSGPNTSTGILRRHLYEHHLAAWVNGCDQLKITIKSEEALKVVNAYRAKQNSSTDNDPTADSEKPRPAFSKEAFVDAIVEWIVSDDQSINVIENEKLRNIFLMLRAELKDSDIPHRTKIRQRVMEIWDAHLDNVQAEMAVSSPSVFIARLGWVTLDNASNCDTFVDRLASELRKRGIPFNRVQRRIRCFPHIVNLACKAVLAAITNMDFAAITANDFVPQGGEPRTFGAAVARDPIATLRTSIRLIRASSLRRQYFSEVLKALQKKDLQLLRDVDTRWSSTLIMIDRAVLLREAIDQFLSETDSQELKKCKLSKKEWEALEAFQRILSVPHAFQQRLSSETTPTLGHALPAFEAMISQWEKQQASHPETARIVQKGIDKLEDYRQRVEDVPAYTLSMRK
ncbi:HAT family dimerization domain-containing protein, partial [Favolaschia claudopus]